MKPLNLDKTSVWFNGEVEFVGITGADSLDQAAEAILHDNDSDILDLILDGKEATLENLKAGVREVGMTATAIPSAIFRQEHWDGSNVYRIAETERPGRGFVKVFGFNP